jgi:hypothetical protein
VTHRTWVNGQLVSEYSDPPQQGTITADGTPGDAPPPPEPAPPLAQVGFSLGLDLLPLVGEVKGVMEAITGWNLVTGEPLAPWERLVGVLPMISDVKKVFDTGDNIVKMADVAKDAAKAAEAAGDVTKANKAADAADVAVDATRRGVEGAEATGDAAKVAEAQANYQKAEAAAQEAREAAQRSREAAQNATNDLTSFTPPTITRDRHDRMTNGLYTLDETGMMSHLTGSLAQGKSQFLNHVDARKAVLDAAAYADRAGLWIGSKAKVPVANGPVGVHGGTGELTNIINVYRNRNGFVHGAPGTP